MMEFGFYQLALSFFLGLFAFSWRFLVTTANKKVITALGDSAVHFYYCKALRDYGKFRIRKDGRFVVDPATYRPQLIYKLLASLASIETLRKYSYYVNPLIESIFTVFLFNSIAFLLKGSLTPAYVLPAAASITVFYVFSPLLIFFPERVAYFGERLFSYILGMASFIVTVAYLENRLIVFFLAIVLLNLMVIYSSQFTFQAVVLLQFGFTLLSLNLIPFLTVLIAFLIVFVFDAKWLITYLKAKHFHFKDYHRKLKQKQISLAFVYDHFWKRTFVFGLPYIMALIFLPDLHRIMESETLKYMSYYIISSLALLLLVYLPLFRPIGEAIRYLEYSLPFVLTIIVYLSFATGKILPVILLFFINLSTYIHYVHKFVSTVGEDDQVDGVVRFLQDQPGKTILPIPFKLSYFLAANLGNNLVASVVPRGKIDEISKYYNRPIDDFEKIKSLYDFDYIVYKKNFDKSYDFSTKKIVYQNENYIIFKA